MHEEYEDQVEFEKVDLMTWKKIFKIISKCKKELILMLIAITFTTFFDIFYPLLNRYALKTYFSENPDFSSVPLFIVAYFLLALMLGVTVWFFIKATSVVEEATTYEIRKKAFDNLQKLSFSYFDTTPSGWVMARMTSDARRLSSIISWGLIDIFSAVVLMIGILITSFIVNWRLALILVALIPIFILVAVVLRKKILKEYREVRKINSQITGSYNESFMGSKTTKTLVLEKDNEKEFFDLTKRFKKRAIRAAAFSALFWPSILVIGYFGVAVIGYWGSTMVVANIILVADLYLFIDYSLSFFNPIMNIANIIAEFQQAQASAERIITLIETPSDIVDTPEVIEKYGDIYNFKRENWEPLAGDITFENVTFRYKNTEVDVLENFNLEIKAGEMVAFVGETGSGKSTIVNLICRFYEPTTGRILLDGRDYKERSISWLHANLGYVLQTPQLFSTTIKENIRYGRLDATDEEIIAASKLANAHDFIIKLDKGYDTEIGEGGNRLSVGQKQLISFARAVIANPAILILDEATSSIDSENEKTILEAMRTVLKNRTSLVVAHRLSTIVDANKIIVMKNGKVIEQGTHKELLANKNYYFQLYKNQFLQELEAKKMDEI